MVWGWYGNLECIARLNTDRLIHDNDSCCSKTRLSCYQSIKVHQHILTHTLWNDRNRRSSWYDTQQVVPPSYSGWQSREGACGEGASREGTCGEGTCREGASGEGTCGEGASREGTCGEGTCREGASGEGTCGEGASSDDECVEGVKAHLGRVYIVRVCGEGVHSEGVRGGCT